jgi:mono/diheme cytochrome c family protein
MTESSTLKLFLVMVITSLLMPEWSARSIATIMGEGAAMKATNPKADGAALFRTKCAICHANDGRGKPNWRAKGQPDFSNSEWQKSRSDSQLGESIKNGKGKFMPAFKDKLSEDEINALVGQVRAYGKKS